MQDSMLQEVAQKEKQLEDAQVSYFDESVHMFYKKVYWWHNEHMACLGFACCSAGAATNTGSTGPESYD